MLDNKGGIWILCRYLPEHWLEQPEQLPEHFAPLGQPMHLIPLAFDRCVYHSTRPTITATTAMTIRSISFMAAHLFFRAYSAARFRLALRISATITRAMTTTTARPMRAAVTFREAGAVIRVPMVYTR